MRLSVTLLASASAMALLVAGGTIAGTNPDSDGDGVFNLVDNCIDFANNVAGTSPFDANVQLAQQDTDNDGFGNRCDGDFTNNGITNAQDTALNNQCLNLAAAAAGDPTGLEATGGVSCLNMDLNDNGFVNAQDTALFNQLFNAPFPAAPGPSGLRCARLNSAGGNMTGRHPCHYDTNGSLPGG